MYYCATCSTPVVVVAGSAPVRGCGCQGPIVAEAQAQARGGAVVR